MSKYIASKNQNLLSTSLDSKSPNVWWCTPVIPALVRLRLEDCKFEASLDYKVRLCFKKKKKDSPLDLSFFAWEMGEKRYWNQELFPPQGGPEGRGLPCPGGSEARSV
jgi:hypothetical protein